MLNNIMVVCRPAKLEEEVHCSLFKNSAAFVLACSRGFDHVLFKTADEIDDYFKDRYITNKSDYVVTDVENIGLVSKEGKDALANSTCGIVYTRAFGCRLSEGKFFHPLDETLPSPLELA